MHDRRLRRRNEMLRLYRARRGKPWMALWNDGLDVRRLRGGDRWLQAVRDRARSSVLDGWWTDMLSGRWRPQ